jgi:dTDP-4-dehydrorhamnose reductase
LAEEEANICWNVNVDGTRNLAKVCREMDAKMIYISTDYVFPGIGTDAYETDSPTGPLGVYGRTKLAGELAVQSLLEKFFIVRISWVFGKNGGNFVKTMLRLAETRTELGVVSDQIGSPTYTADLSPLLCDMVESEQYGVYHATNEGVCSWAEFAEKIMKLKQLDCTINPLLSEAYPAAAKRPAYSVLDKTLIKTVFGVKTYHWEKSLSKVIKFF